MGVVNCLKIEKGGVTTRNGSIASQSCKDSYYYPCINGMASQFITMEDKWQRNVTTFCFANNSMIIFLGQ